MSYYKKIWIYRCTNGACRFILQRTGMRRIHEKCPQCGHIMILVDEEEEDQ